MNNNSVILGLLIGLIFMTIGIISVAYDENVNYIENEVYNIEEDKQ